ncbi:acyltransferase family protein [Novosphingobium album (ex Hu et al. 2023)]|uniref:Acyltransferase n=1 Tax=Novosphingobium album (ex Hu et al. 2023) TaxID=2930093 RepID=A0ABT0B414_9SPHN|nr:acyltransferase [Novosphingobium album (ex Hu et al. 2023)]MCJ2179786.1 acyltransferase [Novosphingobium album (ex Hu et al. 2023)]
MNENAINSRLPRAFSIYLDLIRFLSALAVLADHFLSYPFGRPSPQTDLGIFDRFTVYGQPAVITFFVLSGYVIGYVVDKKERNALIYTVSRLTRLYSVVFVAIIITFILDTVGREYFSDFYSIQKVLWHDPTFSGYVSSLLFVNEYRAFPWAGLGPGSNGVFWSLSFEATYYLCAGLVLFAPRVYAVIAVLFIAVLSGPTITALAPVWIAGYFLYCQREKLRVPIPVTAFLVSAVAIVVIPQLDNYLPSADFLPWGRGAFPRPIVEDYLIAAFFSLHLVSAYQIFKNYRYNIGRLESLIRHFSAQTFPLYAIHFPVLCIFSAMNPYHHWSLYGVLFTLVPLFAITEISTRISNSLRDFARSWALLKFDKASSVIRTS